MIDTQQLAAAKLVLQAQQLVARNEAAPNDACLGSVKIDARQLLKEGNGIYDGWFDLSNETASVHLSLRLIGEDLPTGSADISDDEDVLPVNAVMLRIYWDRLLKVPAKIPKMSRKSSSFRSILGLFWVYFG